MKARLSALDLAAVVGNLRASLIGMRVAQVYDINPKTYMLKFSRNEEKVQLLFESGVRIHRTIYQRDKSNVPSSFTIKLRKHLRTKRLTDIQQLGVDRVLDLSFGSGEACYHVIIEFYASGNVILCDYEYNILHVLRTYKVDDTTMIAVRNKYPLHTARQHQRVELSQIVSMLKQGAEQKNAPLKQAVGQKMEYGTQMFEHFCTEAGIDVNYKCKAEDASETSPFAQKLFATLQLADEFWEKRVGTNPPGFLILHKEKGTQQQQPTSKTPMTTTVEENQPSTADGVETAGDGGQAPRNTTYEDVLPYILYKQYESWPHEMVTCYDQGLDEYFSKMELNRAEKAKTQTEATAVKKVEYLKHDQIVRIQALEKAQDEAEKKARIIEAHTEEVDAVIAVVRAALSQSVDWQELSRVIKEKKRQGDFLASLIHSLKLDQGKVTLLLSRENDDEEEEMTRPVELVDIDISMSAYANACNYFDHKKQSAIKQQKTIDSAEQALKAAELKAKRKAKKDPQGGKKKGGITLLRKTLWFEKFHWFITSENFLVIAGRDAQQNELIVKRYLTKGDLYVHADLHGAASCVIKANGREVPPLSLQQAGTMSVCRSSAWDAKVVTSAYYVYPEQVSKTAPSGEYLSMGSFMIRGKKNYLPPTSLVMGYGFLFKLEETCVGKHVGERQARAAEDSKTDDRYRSAMIGSELAGLSLSDDTSETATISSTLSTPQASLTEPLSKPSDVPSTTQPSTATGTPTMPTLAPKDSDLKSGDKYGLDVAPKSQLSAAPQEVEKSEDDEEDEGKEEGGKTGNRRLTAKERKLMKKGLSRDEAAALIQQKATAPKEEVVVPKAEKQPKQQPPKRGQRGKKKGRNDDDFDEEESALRQYLLQSGGKVAAPPVLKSSAPSKTAPAMPTLGGAAKKALEAMASQIPVDEPVVQEEKKEEEAVVAVDSETPAVTAEAADSQPVTEDAVLGEGSESDSDSEDEEEEEAPEAGGETAENAAEEEEEIRRLNAEENIVELQAGEIGLLDSLTGVPLADDILMYAIPVCGPYSAIQGYKFKVKLTPGHQKKGKVFRQSEMLICDNIVAVSSAVHLFTRIPECTSRERELIQMVPDSELVVSMIGNVTVSAPGAAAAKKGGKPSKSRKK